MKGLTPKDWMEWTVYDDEPFVLKRMDEDQAYQPTTVAHALNLVGQIVQLWLLNQERTHAQFFTYASVVGFEHDSFTNRIGITLMVGEWQENPDTFGE